ncbi:hypothetical protein ILYODFUR_014280 [Ilyodon furcidens]|uniref:Uncharacterized protein n=1 Tax=Ilyodon furcidens TaxID=33524 RepID=A0ABV0SL34_9TELE
MREGGSDRVKQREKKEEETSLFELSLRWKRRLERTMPCWKDISNTCRESTVAPSTTENMLGFTSQINLFQTDAIVQQ